MLFNLKLCTSAWKQLVVLKSKLYIYIKLGCKLELEVLQLTSQVTRDMEKQQTFAHSGSYPRLETFVPGHEGRTCSLTMVHIGQRKDTKSLVVSQITVLGVMKSISHQDRSGTIVSNSQHCQVKTQCSGRLVVPVGFR